MKPITNPQVHIFCTVPLSKGHIPDLIQLNIVSSITYALHAP